MSARIGRSVGELLLEADTASRGLMFDASGDDAPAMLRAWGEVVQSASDLWHALPALPGDQTGGGQVMEQLVALSRGMHRTQLRRGWPGEGPPDDRLVHVAATFSAAGDLVARHAGAQPGLRPGDPVRDVEAARARTMHALYVGGHAVGVAVREHVRALTETPGVAKIRRSETRGIQRGQEALERLAAFEQLAGGYLGGRLSASLDGEHREAYTGLDRLSDAIASWDLQAHRTLAGAATPANLAALARTQAMISRACLILLRAAAHTGAADPLAYEKRTGPALEAAMRSASHLAGQWSALTSPQTRRMDPQLWTVDADLQAATRELIHDKTVLAEPALIAQHADLREAPSVVAAATASVLEIACAAHETAVNDTTLMAPAQAILTLARREMAIPGQGDLDTLRESIAVKDRQLNRQIPLIDQVRDIVARSSAESVQRSADASSATSAHWRLRPPVDPEPHARPGRHLEPAPPPAANTRGLAFS